MRPLIIALAAGTALGLVVPGQAQVLSVQVLALDCTGNPEVVTIRNTAHFAQTLTGWTLQSDAGESFDLGLQVGSLDPIHEGGQISVYSNSQAPATNPALFQYRWTTSEVFRDGDGTDFVRIVDGAGGIVYQENCLQQPAPQEPTPSPSQPTATPPSDTAAPEVTQTGMSDVSGAPAPRAAGQQLPSSGGRPPGSGGLPATAALSLAGAAIVAGVGLLALSRKGRI